MPAVNVGPEPGYLVEIAPLMKELKAIGVQVGIIDDLFNRTSVTDSYVDILMKWLSMVHRADVKEAIVRALSVRRARGKAAKCLIDEFISSSIDTNGSMK